ncbi:DUF7344 domain-containing protein [Halalkalicoccus tibetensis]|uniref:DUF7344 domain-containing protein n=1 Tax=Halalkalicoccus tibetensis TaxID=175632 RepID=A0ABD5UYH6_9EURY
MSEGESSLTEGEIHDILRNDRRRAVIEFLFEHDRRATIRELSEHIAALESGEEPPPRNIRQSVYVSLHQTHLPKLEGLGVVDYDTDSKDVELRDQAEFVAAYMGQTDAGTSDSITIGYIGLGTFGLLLAAVGAVTGSILGIDTGLWVLPVFAAVVALGGYQLRGA